MKENGSMIWRMGEAIIYIVIEVLDTRASGKMIFRMVKVSKYGQVLLNIYKKMVLDMKEHI